LNPIGPVPVVLHYGDDSDMEDVPNSIVSASPCKTPSLSDFMEKLNIAEPSSPSQLNESALLTPTLPKLLSTLDTYEASTPLSSKTTELPPVDNTPSFQTTNLFNIPQNNKSYSARSTQKTDSITLVDFWSLSDLQFPDESLPMAKDSSTSLEEKPINLHDSLHFKALMAPELELFRWIRTPVYNLTIIRDVIN
jgi:hypothetical protein